MCFDFALFCEQPLFDQHAGRRLTGCTTAMPSSRQSLTLSETSPQSDEPLLPIHAHLATDSTQPLPWCKEKGTRIVWEDSAPKNQQMNGVKCPVIGQLSNTFKPLSGNGNKKLRKTLQHQLLYSKVFGSCEEPRLSEAHTTWDRHVEKETVSHSGLSCFLVYEQELG